MPGLRHGYGAEQSRTVNDLANEIGVSQAATSRHLKLLRERGLVTATRDGANVEYSINDHRLIEALDLLRAVLRVITHGTGLTPKEVFDLFPKSPSKKVARIAGLNKPPECI